MFTHGAAYGALEQVVGAHAALEEAPGPCGAYMYVYVYMYIHIYIYIYNNNNNNVYVYVYVYIYIYIERERCTYPYIYIYSMMERSCFKFPTRPWGFEFSHACTSREQLWAYHGLTHNSCVADRVVWELRASAPLVGEERVTCTRSKREHGTMNAFSMEASRPNPTTIRMPKIRSAENPESKDSGDSAHLGDPSPQTRPSSSPTAC